MKKSTYKRGTPLEIIEGAWKSFGVHEGVEPVRSAWRAGTGFGTSKLAMKRGKHLKRATFAMIYGASDRMVQRSTGLSNRRIRVLRKEVLGSKRAKVHSESRSIESLSIKPSNIGPNLVHALDTKMVEAIQSLGVSRVDTGIGCWEYVH